MNKLKWIFKLRYLITTNTLVVKIAKDIGYKISDVIIFGLSLVLI